VRQIAVVALARKLLVALWRHHETGLLPEGAVRRGDHAGGIGRPAPDIISFSPSCQSEPTRDVTSTRHILASRNNTPYVRVGKTGHVPFK